MQSHVILNIVLHTVQYLRSIFLFFYPHKLMLLLFVYDGDKFIIYDSQLIQS